LGRKNNYWERINSGSVAQKGSGMAERWESEGDISEEYIKSESSPDPVVLGINLDVS
jgi:hypothetical protein